MSECQTKAGNPECFSLSLSLSHSFNLSFTHSRHAEQLLFSTGSQLKHIRADGQVILQVRQGKRGITIDIALWKFETDKYYVTMHNHCPQVIFLTVYIPVQF